ncbi:polysaccharide biosynthesis protein [Cohnella soli]|uniref:Polysaccharide biosynthesis protein n=1 Tax=Cohnella soli TaxID=425005 RepID=A0ABW0I3Z9_9BACL
MKIEVDPMHSGKKALWQGAALLGGAALLSKVIGTLQKIPLQNVAGDEVFGLYSAVYALAIMWMTLAAAGVPVAVSALVADRTARGDEEGAQRILRWALGLLGASGLVMFALLWLGADVLASWMKLDDAAPAIRMSSLALLFAPATAVLRGYEQGRMRMLRPAVSQLAEQTARVTFMLVALFVAVGAGWSAPATAAAVHGGLATGAIAGLVVMVWTTGGWFSGSKPIVIRGVGAKKSFAAGGEGGEAGTEARGKAVGTLAAGNGSKGTGAGGGKSAPRIVTLPESRVDLVKRIAKVAVPVAAASITAPLIGLIDAFSIPRLLQSEGATAVWSMAQFGVYNRGVALLQLVVMAAAGAAGALVPAFTAARARGMTGELVSRAAFSLRSAWWFGCAAAVGLAILAAPINEALFADRSGTAAMALIALAAAGGTLQAVSAALLQGLGDLRSPAVNLAAAALLKLTLNAALVPAHGIIGAAAAMAAAYAAAALLNALSLRQRVQLPAPRASLAWRSGAALAAMAAAAALVALLLGAATAALPARVAALLVALPGVAVGAAVFAAALVAFGAARPQQWRELPGFASGSRLDALLLRIPTLPQRKSKAAAEAEGTD